MTHIPRVNEPIGATGLNLTPENLAAWINYIAPIIEAAGGGVGALNFDITGQGRVVGYDYYSTDATAPKIPTPPSLAIEVPNSTWYVQGHKIVLADPSGHILIPGVPANMTGGKYGYVSALEVEDGDGEYTLDITSGHWYTTLQPSLTASGLVCIGKATSNADQVTAIDKTYADVIVPNFVLGRALATLSAGTGGGDGGAASSEQLPVTLTNPTSTFDYFSGEIARVEAKADAATNQDDSHPTELDQLWELAMETKTGVVRLAPDEVETSQMSAVTENAGHGQNDTPDFSPTTGDANEMVYNTSTGVFG